MMFFLTLRPTANPVEQKRRVKAPLIWRFPSPFFWLGEIFTIKPGRRFEARGT